MLVRCLRDPAAEVRSVAASCIAAIRPHGDAHIANIASLLKDSDATVRCAAALALGQIGDSAAVYSVELAQLFRQETRAGPMGNVRVQHSAFYALIMVGDAGAKEAAMLLSDEDIVAR